MTDGSNTSQRRHIAYFDSNELDYRQENTIFQPALNGQGLTITVRGKLHEVDSIVDIKDAGLLESKFPGQNGHSYKFRLEMCCGCCKGRSVWYSIDAIFDLGNQHLQDLAI